MPSNSSTVAFPRINRRRFLQGASAALAASCLSAFAKDDKVRRVGLIGTGWYGKSDLCRLIQVSPVDVIGQRRPWSFCGHA